MYSARIAGAATLLLLATAASAQTPTFARRSFASVDGARAVAAADFDENGWVDVAHANGSRNSVTILLNAGGTLTRKGDVAVGTGPFDIAAADFNRDGHVDLAVANADSATLSMLFGRGDGTFSVVTESGFGTSRGLTVADMDGDSWPDIVYSHYDGYEVEIWRWTAAGLQGGGGFSGYASRPQGVTTGDFNRDGRIDIAVAYESSGGVAVWLNNGNAPGTYPWRLGKGLPEGGAMNVIASADLNRDGWLDLAAASTQGNRIAIYLGSAGGMRFLRTLPTGSSPRDITIADINLDGRPDILCANYASNSVSIFLGTGDANVVGSAIGVNAGPGSRALTVADFDIDGLPDIVTGNQLQAATTLLSNSTRLARAGYVFRAAQVGGASSEGSGSDDVFVADFNRDGRLDLVTLASFPQRGYLVFITGGATVFLPSDPGNSVLLGVADLNRDGNTDIVTLGVNRVLAYMGDGAGAFTLVDAAAISGQAARLRLGDVTRDGLVDVVYSYSTFPSGPYGFVTLPGRADGTFGSGINTPTDKPFLLYSLVDLDTDGHLDVVATNPPKEIAVWRGTGEGTFEAGQRFPSGTDVYWANVKTGDLDHDGYVDLVVAGNDGIGIFLGSAAGLTFSHYLLRESASVGDFTFALEDVNLDGNLDIALVRERIFFGRGDGTFGEPEFFDYGGFGNVKVTDFNSDGVPDVLYTPLNGIVGILYGARSDVNQPPQVTMNDVTFSYQSQFIEDGVGFSPQVSDPDAHLLRYVWRDESGAVVGESPHVSFMGRAPGTYQYEVTVSDGRGGSATDTFTVTITPVKEIVLYTASAWGVGWDRLSDPTAAAGVRVHDPNLNRPKVNTPEASPARYQHISFVADPTQTYKLWVRLKADGNSYGNDSVWLQIDGAVDSSGRSYEPFTTSGLAINLEECSGCGVAGWGWEDDGWGAVNRNGTLLHFPTGGRHYLRIQSREDGVSIDQIVLSAEKYVSTRPGAAKNDSTILPFTYWEPED